MSSASAAATATDNTTAKKEARPKSKSTVKSKNKSPRTKPENTVPKNMDLTPIKEESMKSPSQGESPELVIGPPLQSSSPIKSSSAIALPKVQLNEGGGDGDAHSVRSVQNLLSPIHRSRACHQFHLASQLMTPSQNQSLAKDDLDLDAQATLDRFLSGFEGKSKIPIRKPDSIQQDLILNEKIAAMGEEDAKKLLAKVVKHNVDLRQELRSKDKRITSFKGQMMAILEWKAKQEMESSELSSSDDAGPPDLLAKSVTFPKGARKEKKKMETKQAATDSEDATDTEAGKPKDIEHQNSRRSSSQNMVLEEVFGFRRMSLSFMHDLATSIDVDQEVLRHRIKDGCYMTNQLLLGGISGWLTALFLKKFGKLALSAVGGGMLLLVYTTRKGYVNVNYDSIYMEISKICDATNSPEDDSLQLEENPKDLNQATSGVNLKENPSDPLNTSKSQECNTWDKLRAVKKWLSTHTYTVGGFALTFIYNVA